MGILIALVQFAIALGLLAMKKWAWVLALAGVTLTVIEGIIGMFTSGPFGLMCGSLGLTIPAFILVYLRLPRTRQAFGFGTTGD